MTSLFVRLLEAEDKEGVLEGTVAAWRAGADDKLIFEPDSDSFSQVPGSPFAYWVSDRIRRLFTELSPFESEGRTAKVGLQTSDDFRFVRTWWEVEASSIGEKWYPFAKGGRYSPFYADVHPVVNWAEDGREAKAWAGSLYGNSHWSRILKNVDYFFRPGLTWPLRGITFSAQAVPTRCVFSVAGKMAFDDSPAGLSSHLGLFNSSIFDYLVRAFAGKVGGVQYEVGLIQRIPIPAERGEELNELATRGWGLRRAADKSTAISHAFEVPRLLRQPRSSLETAGMAVTEERTELDRAIATVLAQVDDVTFKLYGISDEDRARIQDGFGSLEGAGGDSDGNEDEDDDSETDESADLAALCGSLLEWCVGVAFGRFDIRLATGDREPPPNPEPFDPLPICSPGMLQDPSGLPAKVTPPGYPIEIPTDGILVDDPGHPADVGRRIEQVFDALNAERGHAWLAEACEAVGADLRTWLARSCFDLHLKRYSKSRRKAPVFWQLGTKSRSYSVWLYYPRLTKDTLYRVLNDYVTPKLRHEEQQLTVMAQATGTSPTARQRKGLAGQEDLVAELRSFRAEVERVAPLWRPAMDDGVILNMAPLWRLLEPNRSWQREAKKKWGELAEGKYDWAQWAMHLWPERVAARCAEDRSLAIAHGLEEALWEQGQDGRWTPKDLPTADLDRLVDQRHSAAVHAARDSLLNA